MSKVNLDPLLLQVQKPGRYTGGELNSVVKDLSEVDLRFAFCFPDTYEIGMSHLGMKILYSLLNSMEGVWCERVFAPWTDMERQMREQGVPLFGLESREPIRDFDFIGFTMQYELSYTNVLYMLDLAGVPLRADERGEKDPIVILGGPCVCNPEPLADFADLVSLGEGEEVLPEVMQLYRACKKEGTARLEFLRRCAKIPGIYVPAFYDVSYRADGTVDCVRPQEDIPATVQKRIVKDLDSVFYPESFVVPYLDVVHDRAVQEVFRGCVRGCRFCQAGFIYRPVRAKSAEVVNRQARSLCDTTGYDEVSLCSLSTSDYRELNDLLAQMLEWTDGEHVSISLPSLRIDNFPKELLDKIQSVRKSGLTFAPEAGTQRMRDVINKNITEDEILGTSRVTFAGGNTSVKLYFMLGLPTETMDDVAGIADLAQKVVDTFYSLEERPKGKGVNVSISVASFVPKPFTPFQWEPQDSMEQMQQKQQHLVSHVRTRKISVSWHDSDVSFLEGVFARGDRRLGRVLQKAYEKGCYFDSWSEQFSLPVWMEAFEECGLDPAFYNQRRRSFEETLPWDHLDYGIRKEFLIRENERAHAGVTTRNCFEQCAGCGADRMDQEACHGGR